MKADKYTFNALPPGFFYILLTRASYSPASLFLIIEILNLYDKTVQHLVELAAVFLLLHPHGISAWLFVLKPAAKDWYIINQ